MPRRRRVVTQKQRRNLRSPMLLPVRWHDDGEKTPAERRAPSQRRVLSPQHACPSCGKLCREVARQLADNGRLFCTVACRCGYLRVLDATPEAND